MNKKMFNLTKGIWVENPVLVSLLGLCSVLAITKNIHNALGMGIAFAFVIILSNVIIALIKNIVPNEIRIPIFIVVVATLVTVVEMLMEAFLPSLYESLGIFIPLIVVNCIILGRAEAFASRNDVYQSLLDAIGMAIGYTLVLIVLSFIREVLGSGTITIWEGVSWNINETLHNSFLRPVAEWLFGFNEIKNADGTVEYTLRLFSSGFFLNAPSAFIILGFLLGFASLINNRKKKEVK